MATKHSLRSALPPTLPWDLPTATDLLVTMNTRIPHRLALKLDWVKDHMGITKQQAVEEALSAFCDSYLQQCGKKGSE
jgi:hypothetical protein